RPELSCPRQYGGNRTAREGWYTPRLAASRKCQVTSCAGRARRTTAARGLPPARACPDKRDGNIGRGVIGPGEKLHRAGYRLMKASGQLRNLGNSRRPTIELFRALMKGSLEHKGYRNPASRHRGGDTPPGGYRQLQQCLRAAKPSALRLVQKLTLEMCC